MARANATPSQPPVRLLLIVSYGHLDAASEPLPPQGSKKSEFTFVLKSFPVSVLVLSISFCLYCASLSSHLNLGQSSLFKNLCWKQASESERWQDWVILKPF